MSASDLQPPLPLAERVLFRLKGPRPLWILLWGTLWLLASESAFLLYRHPTYQGRSSPLQSSPG